MRLLRAVPVAFALAFGTGGAFAQIDNGLPGPQPMDMGSVVLNQNLLKGVMDHNQKVRGGKGGVSSAGVLVYRVSPAVTERVKRGYLMRAEKAYGPKVAAGLRQLLAKTDFRAEWTKATAPDGMRPNDLGDSLAEYWTAYWMVANGVASSTPAQVKALRAKLGPVVARNPAVRRLSDAQKQEMSETLMLDAFVLVVGANAAQRQNDPAATAKLRTNANARFRQTFGVDLTTIKLTYRGIVRA